MTRCHSNCAPKASRVCMACPDSGRKDRLSASRLNHPDKGTMSGTAMTLRSGPRPADSSANTRRAWRLLTVRISVFSEPDPESPPRSEEHTSELQSLMRISYAVFCLKKKIQNQIIHKY